MSSTIFFKEMPINEEDNNSSGGSSGFGSNNSSGGNGGFGLNNSFGGNGGFGSNNSFGGNSGFGSNNSFGGNDGFGLDNFFEEGKSIKECTIESPEGKKILNKPGEIKEVDGNIFVYDSNLPWEQKECIVLPDTNPLTVLVKNMLVIQVENTKYYIKKIRDIKNYALDIKKLDENYYRKKQRISKNLDDEFTKATGFSG